LFREPVALHVIADEVLGTTIVPIVRSKNVIDIGTAI
jgi:hypothetical protein